MDVDEPDVHKPEKADEAAAGEPMPATGSGTTDLEKFGDALAVSPESLPVLNAFREFLEREREQTRRRMFGLMSLFFVILVAMLAAGGIVAMFFLGRVRGEVGTGLQAVAAAREDVADVQKSVEDGAAEINRLRETITSLEVENTMLVNKLNMQWAFLTNRIDAAMTRPVVIEAAPATLPPATTAPAAPPRQPPVRKPALSAVLRPPGAVDGFTWRFALPDTAPATRE